MRGATVRNSRRAMRGHWVYNSRRASRTRKSSNLIEEREKSPQWWQGRTLETKTIRQKSHLPLRNLSPQNARQNGRKTRCILEFSFRRYSGGSEQNYLGENHLRLQKHQGTWKNLQNLGFSTKTDQFKKLAALEECWNSMAQQYQWTLVLIVLEQRSFYAATHGL